MTHKLGSGDSGEDALDERPVGPSRMLHLYVVDLRGIDVDTSKAEARADSFIEATMQSRERDLPIRVDWPVNERDQVEVADTGRVITCRQRPSDKQIAGPVELRQPASELLDNERRGSHERILGVHWHRAE
ncbi:hypothetical protein GCM10023193_11400 [Planotetraspora kaengkrachanensis]|uniref:Uncharacterized protein n=1 Tax=Planotetraspora kaengkrachanensis TaxID=575193 RepID=A0A8J3PW44_9ACTN|nr:hypothetical protein Pka01_52840 [Planotetraspora kaengkrachanensis]